jgi:minimal PKS ketosynthase (KS/KS alpha)
MGYDRRRVVITGMGVMAPGGAGTKAFRELLSSGATATRLITLFEPKGFRSKIAAECHFDPAAEGLGPQEIRRMDRAAQLAVVAAREAIADSGIDLASQDPGRIAVTLGTATGATTGLDTEYRVVSDNGRLDLVDPAYQVGSALNDLSRETGGAVGIAVMSSILTATYQSHLDLSHVPAAEVSKAQSSVAVAIRLGRAVTAHAQTAFTDGMHLALLIAAGIVAATVIAVAALLRSHDGSQTAPQPPSRADRQIRPEAARSTH